MILTNIGRDKSYEMLGPYGLKVWDKVSVAGTISEGEDIQSCYRELDKILEAAHQTTVAELNEFRGTHTKVIDEQEIKPEKTMIEEMESCTTYADIQSFRFTIKNADEQAVYETKLNELTPKNQ